MCIRDRYLIEITRKDKKINNTSTFPSVSVSAQYGYNQNESNTSIILDQSNTGLTGFVNLIMIHTPTLFQRNA